MSELVSNGVQIYQFPTEDDAVAEINTSMNVSPRNTQKHVHNTGFPRALEMLESFLIVVCEPL